MKELLQIILELAGILCIGGFIIFNVGFFVWLISGMKKKESPAPKSNTRIAQTKFRNKH